MDIVLRYEGALADGFTTQLTVAATQIRGVENCASVGASTFQGSAPDIRRMWHGRAAVVQQPLLTRVLLPAVPCD